MIAETFVILTVMLIAVLGPAVVLAVIGYAVVKALSRNPSAMSKIFVGMAVILIFSWAISIVAILVVFQLFSK